jgi:hypothetical protein
VSDVSPGNCPAVAAIPRLHPQGQNSSQDPIGRSHLIKRRNGWTPAITKMFIYHYETFVISKKLNAEILFSHV